jgi:hypothetical protein
MVFTARAGSGIDAEEYTAPLYYFIPSFAIEKNKIYVESLAYEDFLQKNSGENVVENLMFSSYYYVYDYYGGYANAESFTKNFDDTYFTREKTDYVKLDEYDYINPKYEDVIIISPYILTELCESVLESSYRQASLFFENDREAELAAQKMCNEGFIAVPSNTTYTPDILMVVLNVISSVVSLVMWVMAIVFLSFFINLCSVRTMDAFKGDMAIMRSMGISVKVIKLAMYIRMLIALIPAYVSVVLVSVLVYTTPAFNAIFTYLYPWQYAVMFVGVLFLMVRVTKKQIGRLFGESVKKALKVGDAQ